MRRSDAARASRRVTMRRLPVVAVAAALAGCAAAPEAADPGPFAAAFERAVLHGAEFDHVVFRNAVRDPARPLHVYLEGDGRPYLDRWTVAADPTPRRPVMLGLMALDPAPAVYVGRPCYFGLAAQPPCTPLDWTLARFSTRVLASMEAVVERLRVDSGAAGLELYGHSGGGAIAVLLARRLPTVERVVTLAGNLDIEAWAARHRYAPLAGSLNPVDGGPLPAGIVQQHVVGARDRNVPPQLLESAAGRLGGGPVRVIDGADHACCWTRYWPALLAGQ